MDTWFCRRDEVTVYGEHCGVCWQTKSMTPHRRGIRRGTMTEIGSIQGLNEAMAAFKANPNTTNQMVLERAMRVYQCNVTAMEPALTDEPHNHGSIGTVFPRDCPRCKAIGRRGD